MRRTRAVSMNTVPLDLPARPSSPELQIPGDKNRDDQISPKRSSLLSASKSNALVSDRSTSPANSSAVDDAEGEIEYPLHCYGFLAYPAFSLTLTLPLLHQLLM